VYTAFAELSNPIAAVVPEAWFHPAIVPDRVENRKRELWPLTLNPEPAALNTCPVGPAKFPPEGGGIVTTNGCGVPLVLYNVEVLVPAFDTHIGLPALLDIPQGFFRFGSVFKAKPGTSDTRFV